MVPAVTLLNVTLVGQKELIAKLSAMSAKVGDELFKTVTSLALYMENYVKSNKLAGQVLNHISGRLQSSIHSRVARAAASVIGSVFSAAPMPYAAIHEFGFNGSENVRQHMRSVLFGREVEPFSVGPFTRTMHMPERSFMRSSLADNRQKIVDEMTAAVMRGTK